MSSQTVLSGHLVTLMKDVSEALKFDRQERNEDAYKKYLECVLRVSTGLLKSLFTDEGHVFVTKDVEKMVKLGQQCMDRVASIVNERLEKAPRPNTQAPTSLPLKSGPGPPWSRSKSTPTTPVTREVTPVTPSRPGSVTDATLSSLDSMSSSTTRKLGPMEMAARQNQQLLIALRKRQAMAKNRSASATLSLTLQRKMVENLAIARAQEEALAKKMKERQQRLEEQAARRFHTPVGLSEEEQQQRQVYKKVLEFEQENLWIMELRKKFEEAPSDLDVISDVITAVLSCEAHPLTVELQKYQRTILDKLRHIVEEKLNKIENIRVPLPKYVYEQANLKDFKLSFQKVKPGTKFSRSESSLQTVEEVDSTYGSLSKSQDLTDHADIKHDISDSDSHVVEDQKARNLDDIQCENSNVSFEPSTKDLSVNSDSSEYSVTKDLADVSAEIKKDVKKAMVDGKKLKTDLEKENQRLKSFARQATEEYEKYNQENMDDLFDDDSDMEEEAADNDGSESDDSKTVPDDNIACDKENGDVTDQIDTKTVEEKKEVSPPKGLRKNPSFENLNQKIAQLKNEAYHRHLKGITEDILTSIERLQVLFVIVFEQLDNAEGRDQCNVILEKYFFKPVWKYLLPLFRLSNEPKEIALAFIMTENQSCTPETFAVREKLCLGGVQGGSDYPYMSAVTELEGVCQCHTMLEKLDYLVRASKEVMHCVEEYYKQRDTDAPSLGADDLLPVLCYIVVKCGLPQLVSECQAMEKFIHEGYMFGEEGYCLTSFHTAINYLISEGIGS